MLARRVFRQGHSVVIVIPTEYVDELGIRPGDLLAFDMMKDGGLRLRPVSVEVEKARDEERKVEP